MKDSTIVYTKGRKTLYSYIGIFWNYFYIIGIFLILKKEKELFLAFRGDEERIDLDYHSDEQHYDPIHTATPHKVGRSHVQEAQDVAQPTITSLTQVARTVLLIEVTGRDGQSAGAHQPWCNGRQPQIQACGQQDCDVCYLF